MTSSSSWENVNDEVFDNESLVTCDEFAMTESAISRNELPLMASFMDEVLDITSASSSPHSFQPLQSVPTISDTGDRAKQSLCPEYANATQGVHWIGNATGTPRCTIPTGSPSPSLEVCPSDFEGRLSSSAEIVGTYDFREQGPTIDSQAGTTPAMSEALSGLLKNNCGHSTAYLCLSEHAGTLGQRLESPMALVCDLEGCGKGFNQQHRYKYVP